MAYVFPILFLKGIEIYGRLFASKESPKITWKFEQKSIYVWLTFFQTYKCFFKGIEIHGKLCTSKESPRYFWYVRRYLVWKISQDFPAIRWHANNLFSCCFQCLPLKKIHFNSTLPCYSVVVYNVQIRFLYTEVNWLFKKMYFCWALGIHRRNFSHLKNLLNLRIECLHSIDLLDWN